MLKILHIYKALLFNLYKLNVLLIYNVILILNNTLGIHVYNKSVFI